MRSTAGAELRPTLDGSNLALGLFYSLLGAIFALFICYVTYSYVMACCAALLNALLSVVAAGPAMIHGAPRRRAARRLTLFFKHAALLFAYTLYISVTALIVLKMAARGGYADQVGMTHPLARLIMIALFSAAAIGAFRWLKHQLGDHNRHELTHAVTELARHGRDGYQRGRDTYDRGRDLGARAPWNTSTTADGDSGKPLTGAPAGGRPPAGGPPHPGAAANPTRRRHPAVPPPPPPRRPPHPRPQAPLLLLAQPAPAARRHAPPQPRPPRAKPPPPWPPPKSSPAPPSPPTSHTNCTTPTTSPTTASRAPRHHALRRLNPHSSHHRPPPTDATPGPSHRLRRHPTATPGGPAPDETPVKGR